VMTIRAIPEATYEYGAYLLIAAAPQLALILVQLPGTGGLAFAKSIRSAMS